MIKTKKQFNSHPPFACRIDAAFHTRRAEENCRGEQADADGFPEPVRSTKINIYIYNTPRTGSIKNANNPSHHPHAHAMCC